MVIAFDKEVLVAPLKWVIRELLWTAVLSSAATLSGLRRPWLDGRNAKGEVAVRYIDLDLAALGESAREYWANFEDREMFDLGYVVTDETSRFPAYPYTSS